jgi:hypothetical protein
MSTREDIIREEQAFAADMLADLEHGDFDWDMDGECADGCIVEPDGRCPHGYRSWLLVAGLI